MRRWAGCCALVLLVAARTAAADGPASDDAQALYTQAIGLVREERCAEALPLLLRSNALAPSPNSALIIARCRATLGELEAAAEAYAEVVADAGARVAAGDARYAATAEAAQKEGAAIRARLGVLRVRVRGAPAGTTLETDVGITAVVEGQAQVLHRPGEVTFTVRTPSGARVRSRAQVEAGRFTSVNVAPPRLPPPPAPPAEPGAPGWVLPTGIVASVLGVGGLAAFTGFGVSARNGHDELGCLPRCDASKTATIEAAGRDQTIANVSLVAGLAALAVGVPLVVWGWPSGGAGSGAATGARAPIGGERAAK